MTKPRLRVTPTGFIPPGARAVSRSVAPVDGETLVAWSVKVTYAQVRSHWETLKAGKPVVYQPPRAYDGTTALLLEGEYEVEKARPSVWVALVDWCAARKIPPELYVRYCFRGLSLDRAAAPEPAQLKSEKYLEGWTKAKKLRIEELRTSLAAQKTIAATRIVTRQSAFGESGPLSQRAVLTDPSLELSPLFRFCLATSIDTKAMRKVAQTFWAEAIVQFSSDPRGYAKAWKEWLPPRFAEIAADVYPKLLRRLWSRREE
jgi:hypothetical protein